MRPENDKRTHRNVVSFQNSKVQRIAALFPTVINSEIFNSVAQAGLASLCSRGSIFLIQINTTHRPNLSRMVNCHVPIRPRGCSKERITLHFMGWIAIDSLGRVIHSLSSLLRVSRETSRLARRSFLTDQRRRVVVNGSSSRWSSVLSGVPQGTVLGPILFLLFINGLTASVASGIRMFADDCVLFRNTASHKITRP